jgi:hypothetical protein
MRSALRTAAWNVHFSLNHQKTKPMKPAGLFNDNAWSMVGGRVAMAFDPGSVQCVRATS